MGLNLQNLEGVLNAAAADMSIQPEVVLDLFLQSTLELLSVSSDLPLALELDPDKYAVRVYALRQITVDGIGFGEIKYSFVEDLLRKGGDSTYKVEKAELGSFVKHYLTIISLTGESDVFNRNFINKLNTGFKQKLTELTKEKEYNVYRDKEGELISGTVSRVESGNIIVNLGLGEGFLSKHDIMPNEFFGVGATIQGYICEVIRDPFKYQVKLTRTRPEFLGALMTSMIPEIENGLIEIKAISRDPGSRAKVAVYSDQPNIDPVGSCIGRDGIRIKAIRAMLGNERIDVVRWDPDVAVFIANALGMEITKFVMHSDNTIEVVFSTDNLFKAKANRQQQVRLVSRLVQHRIKLTSVEEDRERVKQEHDRAMAAFEKIGLNALQIRSLLASEIKSLEDLLDADEEILLRVLSKDEDHSISLEELKSKAEDLYTQALVADYTEAGVDPELVDVPHVGGLPPSFYKKKQVCYKASLAEMDSEEIIELFQDYLSADPEEAESEAIEIVKWAREGEA